LQIDWRKIIDERLLRWRWEKEHQPQQPLVAVLTPCWGFVTASSQRELAEKLAALRQR